MYIINGRFLHWKPTILLMEKSQNETAIIMSCHFERREESEYKKWMCFLFRSTTRQILCDAQNDILVGISYFDAPFRQRGPNSYYYSPK